MKLLLADDHTLFLEAFVQFIENIEPAAEISVAKDMQEAIERMETGYVPDLVLLDLRMPGMDGLQGLEKIRHSWPEVPVALLSGLAEKVHVEQAMERGAAGFFPKTMTGRAMIDGIRKILAGGHFIPIDYNTNAIMRPYNGSGAGLYSDRALREGRPTNFDASDARLTPREKQVLGHLLCGSSNREIAEALELQVVTIKLHVRGICRKLGARNRTEAALKAQNLGLLP